MNRISQQNPHIVHHITTFSRLKCDKHGSFGMCYDAHQAVVSYTGFSWAIGFAAQEQKSLGISSPAGKPDVL